MLNVLTWHVYVLNQCECWYECYWNALQAESVRFVYFDRMWWSICFMVGSIIHSVVIFFIFFFADRHVFKPNRRLNDARFLQLTMIFYNCKSLSSILMGVRRAFHLNCHGNYLKCVHNWNAFQMKAPSIRRNKFTFIAGITHICMYVIYTDFILFFCHFFAFASTNQFSIRLHFWIYFLVLGRFVIILCSS